MKARTGFGLCLLSIMMGAVKRPSVAADSVWPTARNADVATPAAVMKASYEAISGPPGQNLNLDRFRSLFVPQAQLISVSRKDGAATTHTMTIKEFAEMANGLIGRDGHIEHEIAERVETYGNIAEIWSSFESRRTPQDPHVVRGINSIQLMNDGKRWWITSAEWQHETPDLPLPAKYLSDRR